MEVLNKYGKNTVSFLMRPSRSKLHDPLPRLGDSNWDRDVHVYMPGRRRDVKIPSLSDGLGSNSFWKMFLVLEDGYGSSVVWESKHINSHEGLVQVDEAPWISTNITSRYGIAAIQILAFIVDSIGTQ